MNCVPSSSKQLKLRLDILGFVASSTGLKTSMLDENVVSLAQDVDGKCIRFHTSDLDDVLFRSDIEGREFIQVNFRSGLKILITENLIGFKPVVLKDLDVTRIPKVVTTPDILNIFEAIQDALHTVSSADSASNDLSVLRKVFEAVLQGGEAVGFDLSTERSWISRVPTRLQRASS